MSDWKGFMVSIITKNDDSYQGEITATTTSVITIKKPFLNGVPSNKQEIVIRAEDILKLNFIKKTDSEDISLTHSTVTVAKPIAKRAGRTTSISGDGNKSLSTITSVNKNKNIEEVSGNKNTFSNKKEKSKIKLNKKDEACFGTPVEGMLKDFDFEKNLALFDKQAVWNQLNSQRPDIVKQTDKKQDAKYRHDENILTTVPSTSRQISIPKQEIFEYVTDDGLIIPSISKTLRNKLFVEADRVGLKWEKRVELMGRAATDMTLQLLGGCRRLNRQNTHQCPMVLILCSPDKKAILGINTARQLASHGVKTLVFLTTNDSSEVHQELSLYKLTQNKIIQNSSKLPPAIDFIITSFSESFASSKLYNSLISYIKDNKAPVLSLDPPSGGMPEIPAKYSLCAVLPLAYSSSCGKIYLCNLGFPLEIFTALGITYLSPFGSKFVIPLHPANEM